MVNKSFKQPPPASSAKASETQKNFVLILLKLFLREIYCLIGIQQTFKQRIINKSKERRVIFYYEEKHFFELFYNLFLQ